MSRIAISLATLVASLVPAIAHAERILILDDTSATIEASEGARALGFADTDIVVTNTEVDFLREYGDVNAPQSPFDLMVVDLSSTAFSSALTTAISDHVGHERPLILSAPRLFDTSAAATTLQANLGLACTRSISTPLPIHSTPVGGIDLFAYRTGATALASPLRPGSRVSDHGDVCAPVTGGVVLARLSSTTPPAPNAEPGIVFTGDKLVLFNATVTQDFLGVDGNGTGILDSVELFANEIRFVLDEQVGDIVAFGDTDLGGATRLARQLGQTVTVASSLERLQAIVSRGSFETLYVEYRDLAAAPPELITLVQGAAANGRRVLFFSSDLDASADWQGVFGVTAAEGDAAAESVVPGLSGFERIVFQQPYTSAELVYGGDPERLDARDELSDIGDATVLARFSSGSPALVAPSVGGIAVGAFVLSDQGFADADGDGTADAGAFAANVGAFLAEDGPVALLISDGPAVTSSLEQAARAAGFRPVREWTENGVLDVMSTLSPELLLVEVEAGTGEAFESVDVRQAVADWAAVDAPIVAAGGAIGDRADWLQILGASPGDILGAAPRIQRESSHLGRIFSSPEAIPSSLAPNPGASAPFGCDLFLTGRGSVVANADGGGGSATLTAILNTNNGRTLVNGFSAEKVGGSDTDTNGRPDIVDLLKSQIGAVLSPQFALVLDDDTSRDSVLAEAAERAGLRAVVVSDGSGFVEAFDAGGQQQIAVDGSSTDLIMSDEIWSRLMTWNAGFSGLIVAFTNLDAFSNRATELGIIVSEPSVQGPRTLSRPSARPTVDPAGLFDAPSFVPEVLAEGSGIYADSVDQLRQTATSGGVTGAKFDNVRGSAATVLLRSGTLIWNGFAPRELSPDDGDRDFTADRIEYLANQFVRVGRVPVPRLDGPYTMNEGTTLAVSATGSFDPFGELLTYAWDLDNDGSFDDGTGISVSVVGTNFDGPTTRLVSVRVTNASGLSSVAAAPVEVVNVAPLLNSGTDRTLDQGQVASLAATATDVTGDTVTITWDFGDGSAPATGPTTTHRFPALGRYTVTVTATDDDGASTTNRFVIDFRNIAPTPVIRPLVEAAEGSTVRFVGIATDPGPDDFTLSWDFGDSSPAAEGSGVEHVFVDDGNFTVTLTATDTGGASRQVTATQRIRNVAPTITSLAPRVATEGQRYEYPITVTDPGANDTMSYAVVTGPEGMAISPTGLLTWDAPRGVYTGTSASIRVTDSDGGTATESWDIGLRIPDTDDGGAPDSCEIDSGFDITDPADDSSDPDLDGLPTSDECFDGTNPTEFSGPPAPALVTPINDEQWGQRVIRVTFNNVDDPDGDVVSYALELWDQEPTADGAPISEVTDVAEDANRPYTVVAFDVTLADDSTYFWRVRGVTDDVVGPWSEAGRFFYNVSNQAPSAPTVVAPIGAVATTKPELVIGNATDPEGNRLRYDFTLYRGTSPVAESLVEAFLDVAEGSGGVTSVTPSADLENRQVYLWRARATDGRDYGQFAIGTFRVDLLVGAPKVPTILAPVDGAVISPTSQVILRWAASTDPEGDPVTYEGAFTLAADVNFERALSPFVGVVSPDGVNAEVTVPVTLQPTAGYRWRVRATDGGSVSAWAEAAFTTSGNNTPPSAPAALSPRGGETVVSDDPSVTLTLSNSTDPDEGQVLTYEFQIMLDAEGRSVIARRASVREGEDGTTSVTFDGINSGRYFWRARAEDGFSQSVWFGESASFRLRVNTPDVTPDGGDTDEDASSDTSGGDTTPETIGGSLSPADGCSATGSPAAGWLSLLAALSAVVGVRRRRR